MTTISTSTLPSSGRAFVKSVLSGDGVILRGKPVNGPPPERILSFSNVIAPRLGTASDPGKEEVGAFESREYLRKLLVGKEVAFRVEYTTTTNNRDFGSLSLQPPGVDGETNVTRLLVKGGWVKVKPFDSKKGQAPTDEYTALTELEAAAQAGGLGIWAPGKAGRNANFAAPEDPRAFLEKYKGKHIDAIVDQVRDANTVRLVCLLPDDKDATKKHHQYINLTLTGVKAPTYRVGIPNVEDVIEPYSEEAKYFVESRLLHRDVKVLFEGVAQNNTNFIGTLIHPAGNISEALLAEGFATVVSWQVALVTGGPAKLRAAEQKAKDKKLRVWKTFVAKEKSAFASEFDAIVTRVIGADCIAVLPVSKPDGPERKLYLSSVRTPKPKEPKEAGYNIEAKEFVRQRLIGKTVHVTIDFVKPAEGEYESRECATILNGEQNIAEALISRGLATALRHRKDDDNRASNYDALLLAEDRAIKAQKGLHSTKEPPVVRVNDASETAAKAKQFLPFMQRSGTVAGVVEFASSGSRFKLWVPSQNTKITLVLAGIRCPRVGRTPAEKSEPFGQEALDFANRRILQRDVEVVVESVDKVGGFIGNVFLPNASGPRENFATTLLEHGLATIHDYSAAQSKYVNEFYAAEKVAQDKRLGIWSVRDPVAEAAAKEASLAAANDDDKAVIESKDVYVSEIGDAGVLFVQVLGSDLNRLEKLMADFGAFHAQPSAQNIAPMHPKVGDYVSAKFSADDAWYRARVKKINEDKTYHVVFIDYGNSEYLPASKLRPLDPRFSVTSLPAQAQEARLAFLTIPNAESDDAAYDRIREETEGQKLQAKIMGRMTVEGNQVMSVVLSHAPPASVASGSSAKVARAGPSLNEVLVSEGLAVVDQGVVKRFEADKKNAANGVAKGSKKEVIATLIEAQEGARKSRMSNITLNVKSSNESKFTVEVDPTGTVLSLKEAIAKHLESSSLPTPAENQRLIFAGRVLKDEEVLSTYKIVDGSTIHLVRSGLKAAPPTSTESTSTSATTAATPATPAPAAAPATSPAAANPAANPFAALLGAGNTPGAGANPFAAMGGMPGMGGIGGGMGGGMGGGIPGMGNMDPALLNQLMSNPAVANSVAAMFSNPAFLDAMMASNPQLATMMTPEMRAMMQSEGFRRMMADPNTVRSMMQMAPLMQGGVNPFGQPGFGPGAATAATSPGATGAAATPGAPPTAMNPTGAGGFDPALLSLLMGGGLGGLGGFPPAAALPPPPANPEEAYQVQLRQLQDMGFYDAAENLRALVQTRGNVESAVEWLLNNPPPGHR
ncbi:hypothetical protein HDU76_000645 [Blyttiomyces sp. JEL0837]|nr:hypothetical protein HDU76_000645 [Blyttiomyces sp. JEL0837]